MIHHGISVAAASLFGAVCVVGTVKFNDHHHKPSGLAEPSQQTSPAEHPQQTSPPDSKHAHHTHAHSRMDARREDAATPAGPETTWEKRREVWKEEREEYRERSHEAWEEEREENRQWRREATPQTVITQLAPASQPTTKPTEDAKQRLEERRKREWHEEMARREWHREEARLHRLHHECDKDHALRTDTKHEAEHATGHTGGSSGTTGSNSATSPSSGNSSSTSTRTTANSSHAATHGSSSPKTPKPASSGAH
jgi:hypothetical protein